MLFIGRSTYAATMDTLSVSELHFEFELALREFDEAQEIQLSQADRARELFRSAAGRFTAIVSAGITNGYLEYNLANCYLQSGDAGWAMLHYRRAERLIPGNARLQDNLDVAKDRCLLHIQPSRRSAFLQSVLAWHYRTTLGGRTRTLIVVFCVFWLLLCIRLFVRRRIVTVLAASCIIAAAVLAVSITVTDWADRNAPRGVITAMDVPVSKGPGAGYQRQFEQPLQPGVEFTLRHRRTGWWNIELPDGKRGWIESATAELVVIEQL